MICYQFKTQKNESEGLVKRDQNLSNALNVILSLFIMPKKITFRVRSKNMVLMTCHCKVQNKTETKQNEAKCLAHI